MQTHHHETFTTIETEGALLPADLLARIASGDTGLDGLTPDSYHLSSGEKINEAINQAWNRLLGIWATFQGSAAKLADSDPAIGLTRDRWLLPLFAELQYGRLFPAKAVEIDGKTYPISHHYGWNNNVPIHLVGWNVDLDHRTPGVAGAAQASPHSMLQTLLNRSDDYRWGIVANGRELRLLRDNASLTRQAYVEFDLDAMMRGEVYADFVLLWLLCHQSRVEAERPDEFWLEKWSKTAQEQGTLVDALRNAGFIITEAWPLSTESRGRLVAQDTAALASSIFLVARKRETTDTGYYTTNIQPEMHRIVKERVSFFLATGVTGADLNIATVGAGLAPYTSFARVELPNGDELTAAAYLEEVQAEVVRVLLGEAANADNATQYYIIARDNYGEAWVDFDEANNLARATGIELDTSASALTRGKSALIEKKGAKVRLRNYTERGNDDTLGLPTPGRVKASLIDVLHRLLWLAENDNSEIGQFLLSSQPDRHWLRVVAESLKGTVLAGEPTPGAMHDDRTKEQRAIGTLLASWRRIVDEGKML